MIKVSAPGKLFLSGEWAVLEVGNPGIVAAVNKRVFVEIEENDEIIVSIDDFGIKNAKAYFDGKEVLWADVPDEKREFLKFFEKAIATTMKYLESSGELKLFKIHSWGEESQIILESGETKKIGFGSSAAATAALVGGILALNGYDIEKRKTKDLIYRLSAISHYLTQGKVGSGFDVAASVYGGVFVYRRFDPEWLMKALEKKHIKEVIEDKWPGFFVETLKIPEGFDLLIGWTKESASTSEMVKQLNNWARTNHREYKRIYDSIADLVKKLIPVWKKEEKNKIVELIRKNEDFLRELGQKSGVNIETLGLKTLSETANEQGAAGKLSGAGGGDCGIAVSFDKKISEKVKKEWKRKGLKLIDATIDYKGVIVE